MSNKQFKGNFLYNLGQSSLKIYLKIWHGLTVLNSEKVPKDTGVIIASNHISHLDPPAVGSAAPRAARFVAKDELFHSFFLSWYLPLIGVIPIRRGSGGKEMLDKASEALLNGDLVVMFPEGTRSKSGLPSRPRSGMIVLAAKANVPIIPARISGSYDCMPPGSIFPVPGKIQVAFGDPIQWKPGELDLNNRDQMVTEARRVMDSIMSLPGWVPKKAKISEDIDSKQEI